MTTHWHGLAMLAVATTVPYYRAERPRLQRTAIWVDVVKRGWMLGDALNVARPVGINSDDTVRLFRNVPNSGVAERITVAVRASFERQVGDSERREARRQPDRVRRVPVRRRESYTSRMRRSIAVVHHNSHQGPFN